MKMQVKSPQSSTFYAQFRDKSMNAILQNNEVIVNKLLRKRKGLHSCIFCSTFSRLLYKEFFNLKANFNDSIYLISKQHM